MTDKKQNESGLTKGVLVGVAVIAGVATAIALKDDKIRKKVEKSMKETQAKGMELKSKAEKMAKDYLVKNGVDGNLIEKNPVARVARAIAME